MIYSSLMQEIFRPSLHSVLLFEAIWTPVLFSWIRNQLDLSYWSGLTFEKNGFTLNTLKRHILRKDVHALAGLDHDNQLLAYGEIIYDSVRKKVFLCRIIVRPDSRGMGIGKAFCKKIMTHVHLRFGKVKIELNVLRRNQSAINCYRALGFRVSRTISCARILQGEAHDLVWMSKNSP